MENPKKKFITKDQRQIVMRGKRTRRERSRSHPSVVSSTSSSGGNDENDNDHVYISIPTSTPSQNSACTEEDEDMANCLILLAQSGGGDNNIIEKQDVKTEEKFASTRKSMEIATTNDKTGFYVYECKTCSRSFASFQALGGHRASHKKPKVITREENKIVLPSNNNINEGEFSFVQRENELLVKMSPSLSNTHKSMFKYDHKAKVHECSICGSEFSSGQALGGHMRRHRSITTTTTTTSNNGNINVEENYGNKPRNILQLDLNLPAPVDENRDTKFPFVFVAPAMVGCHY